MIWYDRLLDVIWKERMTIIHNEIEWLLNRIDEYDVICIERTTVNHNEIEWLLNRIDRIMDMIWKERMSVNHNEIEWLLNRIDEYDRCDMYRAYDCQS